MDPAFKLQDKTALITNPTSNLGRAIARQLADYGVNVALVGPINREVERFAEEIMNQREIRERHGKAAAISAHFTNRDELQDAVSKTAELFGGIDIYIDATMVERHMTFSKDFSIEALDELFQMNLRSSMILSHKVSQFLRARKRGRMLYLIQDLHRLGFEGDTLSAATRTSLIHFAKCLAREFQADGVTVNCLAVGPTEEYLLQKAPKSSSLQATHDEVLKSVRPFRMIEAADIAYTVAYLVSPLASTITGQTISASGGLTTIG